MSLISWQFLGALFLLLGSIVQLKLDMGLSDALYGEYNKEALKESELVEGRAMLWLRKLTYRAPSNKKAVTRLNPKLSPKDSEEFERALTSHDSRSCGWFLMGSGAAATLFGTEVHTLVKILGMIIAIWVLWLEDFGAKPFKERVENAFEFSE